MRWVALVTAFVAGWYTSVFWRACGKLTRNDGSGRNRRGEWHHLYLGWIIAFLWFVFDTQWWLLILGHLLVIEDGRAHGYQASIVDFTGWYPKDWELGWYRAPLHKAYSYVYTAFKR